MCGIAGFHRRGNALVPRAGRLADSLLLSIEPRGRDATGLLALLPDGKVQVGRKVVPATRFVRERQTFNADARTLLLHTRWATVGSRHDVRNAHPVISGRCAAIHNGTITNHKELTEVFKLTRRAEVDSEVIPAMIAMAGWEHAKDAIDMFTGGCATAVVNADLPDELLLARTESFPLVYYVTDKFIVWASTKEALERSFVMTYGKRRPGNGRFVTLPDWTMVRVNGKIERTTIRKASRKRKLAKAAKVERYVPKARPRRKRKQMELPVGEPWTDDVLRGLMKNEGMSYAEAFEAAYGISPDELFLSEDDSWSWSGSSWR